ncbi:kelch-like protein 10 [Centruroides vittatus]|uniref:kelch-like protein 10 n=1 Tax=Centruroides vittatus TaxID=120091 RepID=UPI00350F97C5
MSNTNSIQISKKNNKIQQNYSNSSPQNILWKMMSEGSICDSVLKTTDGREFQVHRAILVTCSPYFEALYTSSINKIPRKVIMIPGITAKMLQHIIQFAYMRHNDISINNVSQLISVADKFMVFKMLKNCCDFLLNHINKSNCIDIWKLFRFHHCKEMESKAFKFILTNFTKVAREEQYLTLSVDEVIKIVSHEELNVKGEDFVWEMVLRWIEHDQNGRSMYTSRLIPHVRLGLMDPDYFIENVKSNKYVCNDSNCRSIISEAIKCLFDLDANTLEINRRPIICELQIPRLPYGIVFAIGGWSGESAINLIETYDIKTDSWMLLLPTENQVGPRAYHKCAVVGYKIYILGGFDGTEYFNTCYCFDTCTTAWMEIAPMYSERCYINVAVTDNIIYALGGYNGITRLNSAEKYNCDTNQWQMISSMHFERSDACATELEGCVYVVGGFNGRDFMNSAEFYNPKTNQWTTISSMSTFRSGVSCTNHNGILYVFGGFNGTSRLSSGEKYNPRTKKWLSLSDMNIPRSNFAVVVLEDLIFALGGFNGATTVSSVEYYDIKNDEWIQANEMHITRSALTACVVTDLPNVRDYISRREV